MCYLLDAAVPVPVPVLGPEPGPGPCSSALLVGQARGFKKGKKKKGVKQGGRHHADEIRMLLAKNVVSKE